jgi:hypothetical protein
VLIFESLDLFKKQKIIYGINKVKGKHKGGIDFMNTFFVEAVHVILGFLFFATGLIFINAGNSLNAFFCVRVGVSFLIIGKQN